MSDELNWVIVAGDGSQQPVLPGREHTYGLLNTTVNQVLRYGRRKYGINLDWKTGPGENVSFARESGEGEPVQYGELIAIHVDGGGFVYYKEREYGINLEFRGTPSFEWQIVKEDPHGGVETGGVIAINNAVIKDCVFYDPRNYGINLKWLRDKGLHNSPWYARAAEVVARKALDHID